MTVPVCRDAEKRIELCIRCRDHHRFGPHVLKQRPFQRRQSRGIDMFDRFNQDGTVEPGHIRCRIKHRAGAKADLRHSDVTGVQAAAQATDRIGAEIDAEKFIIAWIPGQPHKKIAVAASQIENSCRAGCPDGVFHRVQALLVQPTGHESTSWRGRPSNTTSFSGMSISHPHALARKLNVAAR